MNVLEPLENYYYLAVYGGRGDILTSVWWDFGWYKERAKNHGLKLFVWVLHHRDPEKVELVLEDTRPDYVHGIDIENGVDDPLFNRWVENILGFNSVAYPESSLNLRNYYDSFRKLKHFEGSRLQEIMRLCWYANNEYPFTDGRLRTGVSPRGLIQRHELRRYDMVVPGVGITDLTVESGVMDSIFMEGKVPVVCTNHSRQFSFVKSDVCVPDCKYFLIQVTPAKDYSKKDYVDLVRGVSDLGLTPFIIGEADWIEDFGCNVIKNRTRRFSDSYTLARFATLRACQGSACLPLFSDFRNGNILIYNELVEVEELYGHYLLRKPWRSLLVNNKTPIPDILSWADHYLRETGA